MHHLSHIHFALDPLFMMPTDQTINTTAQPTSYLQPNNDCLVADPWADDTIAQILGPWEGVVQGHVESGLLAQQHAQPLAVFADRWKSQWEKLAQVTAIFDQWTDNAAISAWTAQGSGLPEHIGHALEKYVQAANDLPTWADPDKLKRAEKLFIDYGAMSVTLLFCASLPQCYVVPDLAAVLQATGQLIKNTDHRIRSTGAMVFPVMLEGGLTTGQGCGIAQILKVRLIHATIRHLILRQSPQQVLEQLQQAHGDIRPIEPLGGVLSTDSMYQALFAHGWDTKQRGLPCNQEELAYTLLTFNYIYLKGMRDLRIAWSAEDENAFLHTWNVAGHFLGIRSELMAHTMEQAHAMFDKIQTKGRESMRQTPILPDPRPKLGQALIDAMAGVIPFNVLKGFPQLLTCKLCGVQSAQDLGLTGHVSFITRLIFALTVLNIRLIDGFMRIFIPKFSIARLITRVLGYHLMSRLLMDQTRPLRLPKALYGQMQATISHWSDDPLVPKWVNKAEDYVTTQGNWNNRA